MKLNLDKCVFGVTVGKLLSFLVLHRGIVANLEKNKIIEAMQPPIHIKDVQKLWGSGAPGARTHGGRYARSLPGGSGPSSDLCTISVKSSTMPR
jgi:hypothetical protein